MLALILLVIKNAIEDVKIERKKTKVGYEIFNITSSIPNNTKLWCYNIMDIIVNITNIIMWPIKLNWVRARVSNTGWKPY